MKDELRLRVRNELGELARVSSLARSLLERCAVPARTEYLTQLALEEILSNVIRHGYADDDVHVILVRIRVRGGRVELEVIDDGKAFDPHSAPEVDVGAPLADRPVGGLGIHLLRTTVDELCYERENGLNRLRLRL